MFTGIHSFFTQCSLVSTRFLLSVHWYPLVFYSVVSNFNFSSSINYLFLFSFCGTSLTRFSSFSCGISFLLVLFTLVSLVMVHHSFLVCFSLVLIFLLVIFHLHLFSLWYFNCIYFSCCGISLTLISLVVVFYLHSFFSQWSHTQSTAVWLEMCCC